MAYKVVDTMLSLRAKPGLSEDIGWRLPQAISSRAGPSVAQIASYVSIKAG